MNKYILLTILAALLIIPAAIAVTKEWKSANLLMGGLLINEKKLIYNGTFVGQYGDNCTLHICNGGSVNITEINGTYLLDLSGNKFGPNTCVLKLVIGKEKYTSSCDAEYDSYNNFIGWVRGSKMKGLLVGIHNGTMEGLEFIGVMKV
jgi:hypothetical protein